MAIDGRKFTLITVLLLTIVKLNLLFPWSTPPVTPRATLPLGDPPLATPPGDPPRRPPQATPPVTFPGDPLVDPPGDPRVTPRVTPPQCQRSDLRWTKMKQAQASHETKNLWFFRHFYHRFHWLEVTKPGDSPYIRKCLSLLTNFDDSGEASWFLINGFETLSIKEKYLVLI